MLVLRLDGAETDDLSEWIRLLEALIDEPEDRANGGRMKPLPIHWHDERRHPLGTQCGVQVPGMRLTSDPDKVTCEKCQRLLGLPIRVRVDPALSIPPEERERRLAEIAAELRPLVERRNRAY